MKCVIFSLGYYLMFIMLKDSVNGFSVKYPSQLLAKPMSIKSGLLSNSRLYSSDSDDDTTSNEQVKKTLEEKMQAWEATEEETKNASLGGITPGRGRTDGFDIGLFIAFPFIVGSALLFAIFPFIMDKIDVSSVGPPPTI